MSVRHSAGRTWIEGVPNLIEPGLRVPWLVRTSKTCTFAGALEAALAVTAQPYSYAEIMALSGMAFRTRWYEGENGPTGCPCAPVGETPDVKRRLPEAIGWRIDEYAADGWDKPIMQEARTAIARSIDAGLPVTVVDRHLNSVVAYGYANGGEVLLLHSLLDGTYECPLAELGQDPSLAHVLVGPKALPPSAQVLESVVSDAAERWHRVRAEFIPDKLKNGRAALEAWIRSLDLHQELASKVDPGRLLFYHLWAYKHLYDARQAAAAFLHGHADTIPLVQADLVEAAGRYRQEANLLGRAYDDPGTVLSAFEGLVRDGSEDLDASQWTAEHRRRERQILAACLALERSAVTAMGKAVSKIR
jgi:hypothetical protein